MKQKTLFLDLDGTLLNDEKQITPGNRRALETALDAGHRVVITTGRPLVSAIKQSQSLGLTGKGCYLIAFNGGIVYDSFREEIIYQQNLPTEAALRAIQLCNERGIHCQAYDETYVLVEPRCDTAVVRRYCGRILMEHRVVPSLPEALTKPTPKILAIDLNQREPLIRLAETLNTELPDLIDCFFSSIDYLEIVPKGLNKGNAVRTMCRMLGIDLVDTIAVGDEENDLTMIEAAGVGVAMANGIPAAKALADYVTTRDNNHDGIAEVVEKFML